MGKNTVARKGKQILCSGVKGAWFNLGICVCLGYLDIFQVLNQIVERRGRSTLSMKDLWQEFLTF